MKKSDKYFFLTGASKGIGRSFLDLLIKHQCFVIILVKNKKEMTEYFDNKKIIIFEGDVCDDKIITRIFSYVIKNKIDIKYLINNAGQRQRKNFLEIQDRDIRNIFDVNFFSVFRLTQEFVRYVKKKKYNASVVNISSIVGSSGFSALSGYGSTKAAITGLTKCLAAEYSGKIRFNSINPGFTKTSFYNDFKNKEKKLYRWTLSRTPMKRWGRPEEIAELIYFLCSDKSSYINGESINIDGGWSNT